MTGLITQSAVLLLARKRLQRIEKLLAAKVRSAGTVNSTERQVLFLARQALAGLAAQPVPDTRGGSVDGSFTPWLADGISMFATAGAVAIDFPQEAAGLAPSQQWLATTLRGGSGDPQRQRVFNAAARMLASFGDKVRESIVADTALNAAQKATALAQMRAFAIGHASQIATLLVAPPYLDSIDAQPGRKAAPARDKPLAAAVRAALESAVNEGVIRAANASRPFWQGWLPASDQLPDRLFGAYSFAAEDVYGIGARVPGSKAFNDRMAADKPPALTAQMLRDGYASYRTLIQGRYGWTYGDWLGATIFMFLPSMLMLPFAALLPNGRDLRRDPPVPGLDTERAWFEVLTYPFAFNALAPLIITLRVMTTGYTGAGKETIFALVNAIIGVVVAIVFFATLGADVPAAVRWPLLLIAPFIADLVLMIFIWSRGSGENRHRQLAFGATMRLVLGAFFIICFLSFTHFAIDGWRKDGFASPAFWLLSVLWMAMMFGAWLGFTKLLMNGAPSSDPLITGRKQNLLLFDQTTLRAQGSEADAPLLYAGDREPVIKLWWTGPGDLFIRPRRSQIEFSFTGVEPDPKQVIPTPLAPITAGDFARLLKKAVADPGNAFNQHLRAERFDADEPFDAPLPSGDVFSDHGDGETTVEAHDAEASKFRKLPKTGDGYVLSLAPSVRQAVTFGRNGELLSAIDDVPVASPPANLLAIGAAGSVTLTGNAASRFGATFRPGDVIELPALAQARVVVAVADDQHLSVNLALASVPGGTLFLRRARDRQQDLVGSGGILADGAVFRQIVGPKLEENFMPGDLIEARPPDAAPERRRVVAVLRPTPGAAAVLQIDAPFSAAVPRVELPPLAASVPVPYARVGTLDQQGWDFAPVDPTALFAGESLLDRAADLATLLGLGAASRLLPDEVPGAAAAAPDEAHAAPAKAQKVFRDWNLNHRRVNEWRLLVQGEATPEPDTHPTERLMGWAPLLGAWLDMAHRPGVDSHAKASFKAGNPTNFDLSSALSQLLELPAPV